MADAASLMPELEDIIQHHSPEQRAQTLSRLTTLFVDGSPRFSEAHVDLFDDVFGRLMTGLAPQVRYELSCRLAPIGNAPIEVSRRLACDDIAVAEPLLRNSKRLTEADLVVIARTKGQAHLLAMAGRAGIGDAITDVLVERGDGVVVRRLAGNHAARLSKHGFAMLAKRAYSDGVLAETIGQRPDFPADLLGDLRAEVHAEIQTDVAWAAQRSAQARMLALRQAGQLGEAEIMGLAKAGQRDETVAALSVLSSVPTEVVERLLDGDRSDPVLILCKAAGFAWPSVEAILALRPKGTASQSLDVAYANFERLAPATARRVLRFWQAQPDRAAAS